MSPFQLDDILEVETQLVTGKHAYTQLAHPSHYNSSRFFLLLKPYTTQFMEVLLSRLSAKFIVIC
jgi:hypothetical protein